MTFRSRKRNRSAANNKQIELPLLLIEDSPNMSNMIKNLIEDTWQCPVHVATSFAEAIDCLKKHRKEYFLVITDLNLPDAENGEIMDLIKTANLPTIVITGCIEKAQSQKSTYSRVFDYILKSQPNSVNYLVEQVGRYYFNQFIHLLVVDDSRVSREMLSQALLNQNYSVSSASNAKDALVVLERNPKIKLIISDYLMPVMNGVELTIQVRKRFKKSQLAIIGLSANNEPKLGLEFIRNGANDFLSKPFISEELIIRINQNLDNLKYIETIENIANRDYLTNLFNRRYFYHEGEKIRSYLQRNNLPFTVALFDIDYFKKINDSLGHDAGDSLLKDFSGLMLQYFIGNLCARIGGEEFVVVFNAPAQEVEIALERFRRELETKTFEFEGHSMRITVSIGCYSEYEDSMDAVLRIADQRLYCAKENGRNQIIGSAQTEAEEV